jgi:hypothetical protein
MNRSNIPIPMEQSVLNEVARNANETVREAASIRHAQAHDSPENAYKDAYMPPFKAACAFLEQYYKQMTDPA